MHTAQLTGEDESHVVYRSTEGGLSRHGLSADTWQAFMALQASAAVQGIDLQIVSAFRNAERQQLIWDAKALGRRAVLDSNCQELDIDCLSSEQLLLAIMRWSALPCTSRHHWGTDLDVYDAAAVPEHYQVQLVAEEYRDGGPFARMQQWLQQQISLGAAEGFFMPYSQDRGGVALEPWHISYAPQARQCQAALTPALLLSAIQQRQPQLLNEIVRLWPELYPRFIAVPAACYPKGE